MQFIDTQQIDKQLNDVYSMNMLKQWSFEVIKVISWMADMLYFIYWDMKGG